MNTVVLASLARNGLVARDDGHDLRSAGKLMQGGGPTGTQPVHFTVTADDGSVYSVTARLIRRGRRSEEEVTA